MNTPAMHFAADLAEHALEGVLATWQSAHPRMGVLALLPEKEKEAVARLQAICARHNIPLVGAIFPALIADQAFCSGGAWLLRFDEMPYVALHAGLPHDAEGAARAADEIASGIRARIDDTPEVTLFLLFDAMVPNIGTLLDELYLRLANRVHYAGANAGSESFQPMPCLFDGTRIIQDGVLVMLLMPHHGAILSHGYAAPQHMISATSTEGNRIIQIDWRPAFDVYQELAQAQFGVSVTRDNFYQYAVHFPFGIVRANHEILVRIPVALEEDGSLFCVGEVPPNSVLALLEAPTVDSVHTLQTLADGLIEINGPLSGAEMLIFYCAGRRLHLGIDAASEELHKLAKLSQASQIAGALSLGEIGGSTKWGYPLFHNATLVAACWRGK